MSSIFEVANSLVRYVAERFVEDSAGWVLQRRLRYRFHDDETLRRLVDEALSGQVRDAEQARVKSALLLRVVRRLLGQSTLDPLMLEHLALATECFSRAPADLPPDSQLYPEQIRAAIALTQRCVLQVNTGEGKTYALLPAAFALACRHHRVYVLCANSYLAWRDATRTRPFWDFLGIRIGLGREKDDPDWACRVVYSTFEQLIFKCLHDETAPSPPDTPLVFSALILDEIDSILLDQAKSAYAVTQPVKGESFDWGTSLEIADELGEGIDVIADPVELTATLTPVGEDRLRERLGGSSTSTLLFLSYRHAVELAYVARHVVHPRKHYVVEGSRVYAVNTTTGRVQPSITPNWIAPLEHQLGSRPRPHMLTMHKLVANVFLDSFDHMSGLSGTIVEDALEYLMAYGLPTVVVPPRFRRHHGLANDLVLVSEEAATRRICQIAFEAAREGRPVLVGTQSIHHAEMVSAALSGAADDSVEIKLLTGLDEQHAAQVFERAGEPGSVVVATQFAGRGVDIRLSDAARRAGGVMLICMYHAIDRRHDLQLLGRVGRHGDPYSAVFICCMQDPLLKRFLENSVAMRLMATITDEDEAIENPLVTRAIRNAQSQIRHINFWRRRHAALTDHVWFDIREKMRMWIQYQQRVDFVPGGDDVESFVSWLVDAYLDAAIAPMLRRHRQVDAQVAADVASLLASGIGLGETRYRIDSLDLEGLEGEAALGVLRRSLRSQVSDRIGQNAAAAASGRERRDAWVAGAVRSVSALEELQAEVASLDHREHGVHADPAHRAAAEPAVLDQAEAGDSGAGGGGPPADEEARRAGAVLARALEQSAVPWTQRKNTLVRAIDEACALLASTGVTGRPEHEDAGTRGASAPCSPADLVQRLQAQRRALLELDRDSAGLAQWDRCSRRGPNEVIHASLFVWWSNFLEEAVRVEHRVSQSATAVRESYRLVLTALEDLFDRHFRRLPGLMLETIARGARPESLDDVFWRQDHRADVDTPRPAGEPLAWRSAAALEAGGTVRDSASGLVGRFLRATPGEHLHGLGERAVERVLESFLRRHPIGTLQNPNAIQSAFEGWLAGEIERGVVRERRVVHRRLLERFLRHLHGRGLVGPLPRWHHRARSWVLRLASAGTEVQVILGVLAASVSIAAFAALSVFVHVTAPIALSGPLDYLDALVFGGLLSTGSITAPAVGALVLTAVLVRAFWPKIANAPRGSSFESLLALGFQVAIGAGMLWGADTPHGVQEHLWSFLTLLAMLLVARVIQNLVWQVENAFGVSALSLWICFTAGAVALSRIVAEFGGLDSWLLEALMLATVLLGLGRSYNVHEIILLSTLFKTTLREGEEVSSGVRVDGYPGSAGHVIAWLLALSAHQLLLTLAAAQAFLDRTTLLLVDASAIAAYGLAVAYWTSAVIRRRLAPSAWEARLNARRQVLAGCRNARERSQQLEAIARRLGLRAHLLEASVLAVVVGLLWRWDASSPDVIVVLLVVTVIHLLVDHFQRILSQLRSLVVGRLATSFETLDLSDVYEPSEGRSTWERVRELLSNRVMWVLGLLIIVFQGMNAMFQGWKVLAPLLQ